MSLLDFLEQKANERTEGTSNFDGPLYGPDYVPFFILSEEDKNYVFAVLDLGCQLKTHWLKFPAKNKLCVKHYYGEDCEECEKETGRSNVRKFKNKDTGVEEEVVVQQKNKPIRKQYAFLYLFNHVGGTRAAKNDPEKTYETSPVVLSDWACGEANTQSKLEKDRNIKNILEINNLGCLSDTIFCMKRTKVKDDKTGKMKDQTNWPTVLPPQAKIKFTIPGKGETTELVSKLQVPTDVREKWDNMTVGEKVGIILDHFDPVSVRKEFWEEQGVVFPVKPEKKEESAAATDESSLDNE